MLKTLEVHNYALIRELNINFQSGFSTITGETGAGKSILLGALGLILGNRTDSSALNNNEDKCVIEATFDISNYNLQPFFKHNELEYDNETIIRREITPAGKSRAFVNDSPTNLNVLKELGSVLVDIHSQHENLQLNSSYFQMTVLDAVASNAEIRNNYTNKYNRYKDINSRIETLESEAKNAADDLDYNTFQFNQLNELNLEKVNISEMEQELELMENAEAIQQSLGSVFSIISESEQSINSMLLQAKQSLESIKHAYPKASGYIERIESCRIDLNDISAEAETGAEDIITDPNKAQLLKEKLDSIYSVMKKHNVDNIADLIEVKNNFENKILSVENNNSELETLKKELSTIIKEMESLAGKISESRKKAAEPLTKHVLSQLTGLGMKNTILEVNVSSNSHFYPTGKDQVNFLFSANKNMPAQNISKIASGGEISRLMLTIKELLSKSIALPTIIFDEIDTGVSGDIAYKMADIMAEMGKNMQVISITHLPQIAARGKNHYRVSKSEANNSVQTSIIKLNTDERINELARMLSGKDITNQAIENAKSLLG